MTNANNWAIVVGINQYEHLPPNKHLRFAVRDAEKIKEFLCIRAGFPPENVLLCSDNSQAVGDISTRPALTPLIRLLEEHTQRARRPDNFWFFFAGHGVSKRQQDYLLPSDGYPYNPDRTAIPIQFVVECLLNSQARNIVLVLDMCRETRVEPDARRGIDREIGRETEEITRQQGKDKQSIITIFSCNRGESSYEIPALEHGAFTYALLNGLGQYTVLRQLEQYLCQTVPQINSEYGKPFQTPLIVPEPGWTYDLPLLPGCATEADVEVLVRLALRAEADGEFDKAKNLWWAVIGATRSTSQFWEARDAIERIAAKSQSGNTQLPSASSFPPVPNPPLEQKEPEHHSPINPPDHPPQLSPSTSGDRTPNEAPFHPATSEAPRSEQQESRSTPLLDAQEPQQEPQYWRPDRRLIIVWQGILGAALLAGVAMLLLPPLQCAISKKCPSSSSESQSSTLLPPPLSDNYANYFSRGEDILSYTDPPYQCSVSDVLEAFQYKETGVAMFRQAINNNNDLVSLERARNSFEDAIQAFRRGRDAKVPDCPGSDPETLIYLNNTEALISRKQILTIAVAVPGGSEENLDVAAGILRGVAQAQHKVNHDSNGIKDRMLQVLIVRDDGQRSAGEPDQSFVKQAARNLVENTIPGDQTFNSDNSENSEILGVIGHYSSDATLAAGTVYDSKLPAISPTSTAVRREPGSNPQNPFYYDFDLTDWVFRAVSTDAVTAEDLIARLAPGQKAIILYDSQSIYSKSTAQSFETVLNQTQKGDVVDRCDLSLSNCVNRVQSQLTKTQATVLILAPTVGTLGEVNEIVRELNQKITILGGSSTYDQDFLKRTGDKSIGTLVGIAWHSRIASEQIRSELNTFWGTTLVGWITPASYDATQAMIEGLRGAKSFTRQALYNSLSRRDFRADGLTGAIEFDSKHDRRVEVDNQRTVGLVVEVRNGCESNEEQLSFCPVD